ncbi:MAG TPA: hypothetical protein VHO95_06360, partial [Candidatus Dormibacteraeota bacterium]|nr:hypothetical protein [Candidatus Dormibacteraeota bacterium]
MADILAFGHGYAARVLLLFGILLALWGSFYYFRNQKLSGGFRASFLLLAGVTAIQGLLGLGALIGGGSPREGLLHMVYGAFATL